MSAGSSPAPGSSTADGQLASVEATARDPFWDQPDDVVSLTGYPAVRKNCPKCRRSVGVCDLSGSSDHQDAPPALGIGVEGVDLEGDDLSASGGVELRARTGAKDDGAVNDPEVHRQDLWDDTDGDPDSADGSVFKKLKAFCFGEDLDPTAHKTSFGHRVPLWASLGCGFGGD